MAAILSRPQWVLKVVGFIDSPVLNFGDLLTSTTITFTNNEEQIGFNQRVQKAMVYGTYQQLLTWLRFAIYVQQLDFFFCSVFSRTLKKMWVSMVTRSKGSVMGKTFQRHAVIMLKSLSYLMLMLLVARDRILYIPDKAVIFEAKPCNPT